MGWEGEGRVLCNVAFSGGYILLIYSRKEGRKRAEVGEKSFRSNLVLAGRNIRRIARRRARPNLKEPKLCTPVVGRGLLCQFRVVDGPAACDVVISFAVAHVPCCFLGIK